jgi:hypothetical protein
MECVHFVVTLLVVGGLMAMLTAKAGMFFNGSYFKKPETAHSLQGAPEMARCDSLARAAAVDSSALMLVRAATHVLINV